MSEKKPTFVETAQTMRLYPMSPADAEFAEALTLTEGVHVPTEDDADSSGHYGLCKGCGELWPCRVWSWASVSAVEWLLAASNEVIAHSNEVWRRHKAGERQEECIGRSRGWYGHGPECSLLTGTQDASSPEQARLG